VTRWLPWLSVLACVGCAGAPPAPAPAPVVVPRASAEPVTAAAAPSTCRPSPRPQKPLRPVAEVAPSPDDPHPAPYRLDEAVAGLSGDYPLEASIETSAGTLHCELYEDVAPLTVANFVGLARGMRPFKDPNEGRWVTRPAYDGSSFHRVIAGFMIQGGDPSRTGSGEPGYVIPDEIDESIHADHRGLLYMANRGPNTNGMQFFILDGAAPHIDGRYTAFGECEPSELVAKIASARTDMRDHPAEPVTIERVSIAFERPCR